MIVIGDMTGKAIQTFDIKEQRMQKAKLMEGAGSNLSIWTNCIVPLA